MEFPASLRTLHWEAYPRKSLPPTYHPEYLIELDMKYSKLEKLWEGIQPLANLNGCLSNFWTLKKKQKNSWLVNKLIKEREVMFPCIRLHPQNGDSCRFWTDNWSKFGALINYLPENTNTRLGIRANATLSSLFRNGHWCIPSPRSERQVDLHIHLTTIALNEESDYYEWNLDGQVLNSYSIGAMYKYLCGNSAVVPWHRAVWNSGGIPRHSFLAWVVGLNRCPTRDRLLSWGLGTESVCLLCNLTPESRDHLFFQCDFSWSIFFHLANRCQFNAVRDWEGSLTQMQRLPNKKRKTMLVLLCWQASIYWLWGERNSRLHRQAFRSAENLSTTIKRQIKERILSLRTLQSPSSCFRCDDGVMACRGAQPPTFNHLGELISSRGNFNGS